MCARGAADVHTQGGIRRATDVHMRGIRGAADVHTWGIRGAADVHMRGIHGAAGVHTRGIRGAASILSGGQIQGRRGADPGQGFPGSSRGQTP
eukprot:867413-Prorocentrum_minimum.AAC.2